MSAPWAGRESITEEGLLRRAGCFIWFNAGIDCSFQSVCAGDT